jgi:hypothetical protein
MTSVDDRDADAVEGVPVGPGRAWDKPGAEVADSGPDALTSADYSVAFSPRNVAIGLAIVAGLVALAASRRRPRADRHGIDEA